MPSVDQEEMDDENVELFMKMLFDKCNQAVSIICSQSEIAVKRELNLIRTIMKSDPTKDPRYPIYLN